MSGCSSGGGSGAAAATAALPGSIPDPPPDAAWATITADWDDVAAAVEVGAGQAECVVVRQSPARTFGRPKPTAERRYLMKHVSGREGPLVVTLEAPAGSPDPAPMRLRCWFGPVSDGAVERRLLDRVLVRLGDLRGRDFAPIRE